MNKKADKLILGFTAGTTAQHGEQDTDCSKLKTTYLIPEIIFLYFQLHNVMTNNRKNARTSKHRIQTKLE